jgi:HD-GYP domain-containing protein (c-di-GMP phosphodiesterase class II)
MEPWRERLTQFGLNSLLAIPFTPDGQRAVLAVYCRRSLGFDEATVQRLETITKEAEFGVSHARVVRRLETTLDETIAALGQMTEASDSYFTGHQIRVGSLSSRLAAMIALQYGLDDKMVKLIRQSGEVHDIGRIAIPSAILTKVEKLSALELDIVKRHTVVGHQILSKTGLPWPVAQVALEHHERMDGSGYPQGMIAGEICLAARIVAVADMIESVTNDRPYRPGITIEKALEQITRDAVTLYDADVVKACVSVFESGFVFQSISPLDFTPVG